MHILVVNDDGPPDCQSSPYVHAFVLALQARGHLVSVVLPHVQRSWIGKAHFVGSIVRPTYFRPGTVHEDNGTVHDEPLSETDQKTEEWVLCDGTPATCAQLGLFHFYQDRGPIDVVVSGPNFGRNTSSLFAMSSGTIGGAMEAAQCGAKGIALSFAFSPEGRYLREPIEAACRLSARLVEYLVANWDEGVDLYNVNVPLLRDAESRKILWTDMLANKWGSGSSFKPLKSDGSDIPSEGESWRRTTPAQKEMVIRQKAEAEAGGEGSNDITESNEGSGSQQVAPARHDHRLFKWLPSFKDVHDTVKKSKEGNDGWAIANDYVSITPLKAAFSVPIQRKGELKLGFESSAITTAPTWSGPPAFTAHVHYDDAYVQPLIENALSKVNGIVDHSTRPFADRGSPEPFLQISSYESINHELLLKTSASFLANSYTIRKALIRKEYLASIVRQWSAKNPDALLGKCFPETISLHLDYAEFLDDALMEGDGMLLTPIFEANESKAHADRSWWMVKASMADRGQGIKLFSTFEELQVVFEEWENPEPSEEEEDGIASVEDPDTDESGEGMTSSLRHFVLQKYIQPFLLSSQQNRKFHVRCYVVAVGALKVYVYRDMLALFSAKAYQPPSQSAEKIDLGVHLTNTCLQDGSRDGSVERFWDLPEPEGSRDWKETQFRNICTATSQLFQAAKASPTDFQPLPNAFELFGVDWLIGQDEEGAETKAWLLEVNAFPDLKQTGDELKGLIGGLWEGIFQVAVAPFFDVEMVAQRSPADLGMHMVLDEDMKR